MSLATLFDVSGHVVYVTGAASGLGLAMAEVMAENGALVTLADIDEAALRAATERLRRAGCVVAGEVLDVGELDRLRASIDATAARHGRLDAVFANAGMSAGPGFGIAPEGAIDALQPLWDRAVHINLTSVFATMQAAAAHMKRQRRGRIVVTSSIAGIKAEHLVGYGYAATKAAVNNLVRQAAVELAPYNVMVNSICPGPFLTNIAGGRARRDPEVRKKFEAMIPLGRLAEPDEIKGLALLLASPASSFITGAVIPIDGGCVAR